MVGKEENFIKLYLHSSQGKVELVDEKNITENFPTQILLCVVVFFFVGLKYGLLQEALSLAGDQVKNYVVWLLNMRTELVV